MSAGTYTIIGILLTFAIFLANVIYRTGHLAARVEELERWRTNMRQDMHEISDKIEEMTTVLSKLATMLEERTDRRFLRDCPLGEVEIDRRKK
jgi:hypothetical protein